MGDPVIVRATPEEIMRQALRDLAAHPPSAKGMDPASRASMFRAELERRQMRARRALDEAATLPPPPKETSDG